MAVCSNFCKKPKKQTRLRHENYFWLCSLMFYAMLRLSRLAFESENHLVLTFLGWPKCALSSFPNATGGQSLFRLSFAREFWLSQTNKIQIFIILHFIYFSCLLCVVLIAGDVLNVIILCGMNENILCVYLFFTLSSGLLLVECARVLRQRQMRITFMCVVFVQIILEIIQQIH